ncbi:Rhamnogalacturonan acetylesterase RhgT [compost metagenome]
MSNYEPSVAPRMGWGQVLESLLGEQAHIYNEAAAGRSSKSFIDKGRLAQIKASIGAGDYLLIQFGHNDEKEDVERHTEPFGSYQAYLQQYIDVARGKQVYPILITPVQPEVYPGWLKIHMPLIQQR